MCLPAKMAPSGMVGHIDAVGFREAVNKHTDAWVGEADLSILQEEYSRRLYRQMCSTGEMLMLASDEERIQEMTAITAGRKHNMSARKIAELMEKTDMDGLACLLLPPGGVKHLGDWQDCCKDKKIETPPLASLAFCSLKSLNRHRAQKRKRVQEEKQKEQVEMSAKKKQAKEAAEQVKQQETTLPPVFGISLETLKDDDGGLVGKPVTILSGPGKGSINSVDAPCCVTSMTALTSFVKNPKAAAM